MLTAKTDEGSQKLNHVMSEGWRLKNKAAKIGGGKGMGEGSAPGKQ